MLSRKRMLILGGTGAIGSYVVAKASSTYEVYVTSRRKHKDSSNIKYICGNAREQSFLSALLVEHWDVIVDFMHYATLEEFKSVAPLFLKSTRKYVFLSSCRVFADSLLINEGSMRLLDDDLEDSSFKSSNEYSLVKAKQENLLRSSGMKNWLIIRPYITYSEQRLQLGPLEKEEWLFRALSGRTIIFCESLMNKITTLTHARDEAEVIFQLIGKDVENDAFNIACPSELSLRWSDVVDIYLKVIQDTLGVQPRIKLVDDISFYKLRPGKTSYQISRDRQFDRRFDISKLYNYGIKCNFIRPEIGLRECLTKFIQDPHYSLIQWASEATQDKMSGEWPSLKNFNNLKSMMVYLYYRVF